MSFSESSLLRKFSELNSTQQSVQTLSLWLIHHRKYSRTIVNIWLKELLTASKAERKLTFIYLANDMLQNSRKKGYEYLQEFSKPLSEAIENTAKYSDDKLRFTLERIFNIWKDRKIYPDEKIEEFKKVLHSTPSIQELHSPPLEESPKSKQPPSSSKIAKSSSKSDLNKSGKHKLEDNDAKNAKKQQLQDEQSNNDGKSESASKQASNKTSLKEEVMKELAQNGAMQPPDSSELINLLQDLEKSASSDAVVREKIAELPSKVNDSNELKNLKDRAEALDLSNTVSGAISLLDNYNQRLQQEMVSRKQTYVQLLLLLRHQNNEIENDQKLIEEWEKKLKQAVHFKKELQTHLESLPDLSTIEVAAERIPLPSAGDLFSS